MNGFSRWITLPKRLPLCALGLLISLWGSGPVIAQSPPVQYRQVFVPQEDLSEFARGYLAIRRERFETLLATLNDQSHSSRPSGARIRRGQYYARLQGYSLIEGIATLTLDRHDDDVAWLELPENQIPLRPIASEDSPQTVASRVSTTLGGRQYLHVEENAPVRFAWTRQASHRNEHQLEFDLRFPQAPITHLILDLPEGIRPAIATGVAWLFEETDQQPEMELPPLAQGDRRWSIHLGGHAGGVLRMVRTEPDSIEAAVTARQITHHRIDPSGIVTTVNLQLDIPDRPLESLVVEVDSRLTITSIRSKGEQVNWQLISEEGAPVSLARVEFTEPLAGVDRLVQFHGYLASDHEDVDLVELPTFTTQNVFWQEAQILVTVADPLAIAAFELTDVVQTGIETLPPPQRGETLQFQALSPTASLAVGIQHRSSDLEVESAMSFQIDNQAIQGRYQGDFTCRAGMSFHLVFETPRVWQIESVETVPADLASHWKSELLPGGRQRVTVELSRALTPQHPVRLNVTARRPGLRRGRELRVGMLQMVQPVAARSTRSLVALTAVAPYRLRVHGETMLPLISPDELTVSDRTRLPEEIPPLLYLHDPSANAAKVSIESQTSSYSAEFEIHAQLFANTLEQQFQIRVTPQGTPVEQFLVHLTASESATVQWSRPAEVQSIEAIDPASSDTRRTWRVTLRRPTTKPIELQAASRDTWLGESPLALVTISDATRQRGTISVQIDALSQAEVISADYLEQLPLDPNLLFDRALLARFRFDPQRDASGLGNAVLSIRRSEATQHNQLIAWNVWATTTLTADWHLANTVIYQLENRGANYATLIMPPEATSIRVRVDRRRVALPAQTGPVGSVQVPLPREIRLVTLQVDYTLAPPRFRVAGTLPVPQPAIDAEVMAFHGQLWLPPQWKSTDRARQRQSGERGSLAMRLLGPFIPRESLHSGELTSVRPSTTLVAAQWPTGQSSPWIDLPQFDQPHTSQWEPTVYATSLTDSSSVSIYRPATMALFGWVLFLAVVPLTLAVTRRWSDASFPLAMGAVLVAAWVDQLWWPISSACFMGVLVGGGMHLLWGTARTPGKLLPQRPARDHRTNPIAIAVGGMILLALGGNTSQGQLPFPRLVSLQPEHQVVRHQQVPPSSPQSPRSLGSATSDAGSSDSESPRSVSARALIEDGRAEPIHPVIVPIDEQQQPVGQYVYVSDAFYQLLHRLPDEVADTPRWVIHSANYALSVNRRQLGSAATTTEVTATYGLEVFASETLVSLPLTRAALNLPVDGVLIDGRSVEVAWNEDATAITLPVDSPGRYQLTIRWLVATDGLPGSAPPVTAVLPVASAVATITGTSDLAEVTIAESLGMRQDHEAEHRIELGPISSLTIGQRSETLEPMASEFPRIDQLAWLRVGPGGVNLEVHLKITPQGKPLTQLRFRPDPRLRLLPAPGFVQGVDDPSVIEWEPFDPVTSATVLSLSFAVRQAEGIGAYDFPSLEIEESQVATRLAGLSVDPALDYSLVADESLEPMPPAEFLSAWGAIHSPPQVAFRQSAPQSGLRVATRPVPTHGEVSDSTWWTLRRGLVDVQWVCDLELAQGVCFTHELSVPEDLQITEVTLHQQEATLPMQWGRPQAGTLFLAAERPLQGNYQIRLQGTVALSSSGSLQLRPIEIAQLTTKQSNLTIRRQGEVVCRVAEVSGCQLIQAESADRTVHLWRPVARYQSPDHQWQLRIDYHDDVPRITGYQTTLLESVDQQWRAIIDFHAQIAASEENQPEATVDALTLRVPDWWTKEITIDPPVPYLWRPSADPGTRGLILLPEEPLSGAVQFRITAPLQVDAGAQPQVPQVDLLNSDLRRRVLLPTQIGEQAIAWDTRGLRPIGLPDRLLDRELSPEAWACYRASGPMIFAQRQPLKHIDLVPQVRLADYYLTFDPQGGYRGVARLDLEPASFHQASLHLPTGCTLVQASVDGQPARLSEPGRRERMISLGPSQLPQRLELVFSGQLAAMPGESDWIELAVPTLAGWKVSRTLWSLWGPSRQVTIDPQGPANASSQSEQQILRIEEITTLLASAEQRVAELPASEAKHWYASWAKRYVALIVALEREAGEQRGLVDETAQLTARIATLQAAHLQLVEQLGLAEVLQEAEVAAERRALLEPSVLMNLGNVAAQGPLAHWIDSFPAGSSAWWVSNEESSSPLRLEVPKMSPERWSLWFVWLGLIELLVAFAWLGWRHGWLAKSLWFQPHLALLLLGVIWALLLQPSAIGLAIIALSLLSLFSRRSRPLRPVIASQPGREMNRGSAVAIRPR